MAQLFAPRINAILDNVILDIFLIPGYQTDGDEGSWQSPFCAARRMQAPKCFIDYVMKPHSAESALEDFAAAFGCHNCIIQYVRNTNTIHANTYWHVLNTYLLVLNTYWYVLVCTQYIPPIHTTIHTTIHANTLDMYWHVLRCNTCQHHGNT